MRDFKVRGLREGAGSSRFEVDGFRTVELCFRALRVGFRV